MTTYVFDRHSCYGEVAFLSDLDPLGVYTEEQYADLVERFSGKISEIVKRYDPTLIWMPTLSEIWGVVGQTGSNPVEFREWWESGADGQVEDALHEAWAEIDEEFYT